ncbi:MAG: hypothetical protein HY231_19245 [Acidobacteria bacterium]|nr:hypothetical protein [Acidobacteriota bacterium]
MNTSSALAGYQVVQQFKDINGLIAPEPYIIPPNVSYTPGGGFSPVVMTVDMVNGKYITKGACGITPSGDNQDFTLSWSQDANNFWVLSVSVTNTTVWSSAASDRARLRKSFDAFRLQLENLELNQHCLKPGGAYTVWQNLACSLPLAISETLYYRYSFDKTNGYVDLLPGMRLRVESSEYETMSGLAPISSLNGFVPSSVNYYNISRFTDSKGNQRLAFDAFLGNNRAASIPTAAGIASGIIDLQQPNMARRYYRLFYPPQLAPGERPDNAGMWDNVTLIGADTLSDLYAATSSFVSKQSCTAAAAGNQPILCTYFRGRTIVVPEILVGLNSPSTTMGQYVPVGTTLRNLLDIVGNCNFPILTSATNTVTNLWPVFMLKRPYGAIGTGQSFPLVNFILLLNGYFSIDGSNYFAARDVYDLPLGKGDLVALTIT